MYVHVYRKACIKYLVGQRWNIIDLREEGLHILLGQRKVKYPQENMLSQLLFKKISSHKPRQFMSQHMHVMPRQKFFSLHAIEEFKYQHLLGLNVF